MVHAVNIIKYKYHFKSDYKISTTGRGLIKFQDIFLVYSAFPNTEAALAMSVRVEFKLTDSRAHFHHPFANVKEIGACCSKLQVRALHHQLRQGVVSKAEFTLPPWQKKARLLLVCEHLRIVWIHSQIMLIINLHLSLCSYQIH